MLQNKHSPTKIGFDAAENEPRQAVENLLPRAARFDLVERDERPLEEHLVLLLQRHGEAVDDGPQDLEELGNAVVALVVVDDACGWLREQSTTRRGGGPLFRPACVPNPFPCQILQQYLNCS